MTEEQKLLALAILASSLSSSGLEKAMNIMSLQRDLGNDPELYYVTIFGTPGGAEPWGWRWEGHHLSQHFTIVDNRLATTPFFLGAWPTNTEAGCAPCRAKKMPGWNWSTRSTAVRWMSLSLIPVRYVGT